MRSWQCKLRPQTFVFMPPAQFSSTVPFTLSGPPSALACETGFPNLTVRYGILFGFEHLFRPTDDTVKVQAVQVRALIVAATCSYGSRPHHETYEAANGVANQDCWPVHKLRQEVKHLVSPQLCRVAQKGLV